MTEITRWAASAPGRSRAVLAGDFLFLVSNARSGGTPLEQQVEETFALLDQELADAGASRAQLVSVDVILSDIADKASFDDLWNSWIGASPDTWPRRAVWSATLTPGLLVEITAIAYLG